VAWFDAKRLDIPPLLSASERDAGALWAAALDALSGRASPRRRAALAAATSPLELLPASLRVAARTSELRAWITSGALSLLRGAVERLTDGAQALALVPVPTGADLKRDPRRDFASFIASPGNAATRERIRRLVHEEPSVPVLVYGAPGSGKTHLLQCAATALRERHGDAARVLTGDSLVLQLVEALWNDGLDTFRARLDAASSLVLDGLEALEGRDATQDELARALGAAAERGAPVLLASARQGPQSRQIVPALAARLGACETFELTAPGWETRVAIILDRVRAWDARATPDVAAHLASALRSDLDRLDAVLTRLMAESGAASGLEDPALVDQILDGPSAANCPPSPEQVIELVARHFGVRLRELRSTSRAARTSTPRQIAIYLLRRHCGLSYPEVARHFRRHHTTALHSDRLVQRQLQTDTGLRATVVLLEKELRSGVERGR